MTPILQTHASDYGVGGYLYSVTNGKVRVIRFFRKARPPEKGVLWYILWSQDIRGPTGQSAFHYEDRPHESDVPERHSNWKDVAMETLCTR